MKASRRVAPFMVDTKSESLVSSAGAALLLQTARVSGLGRALSHELGAWRAPRAMHDPGKVVLDLAVAIALGGDCLADLAVVRAQPDLFGAVASDPTVSRLVDALAADVEGSLAAIGSARAQARARVWSTSRPTGDEGPVVIDVDATLVSAHSEKEGATPTFKRGFGFHPMFAFADHGPGGTGEPLAGLLRPGRATANDAADHITVLDAALTQLPEHERSGVLVRADTGAGSRTFLHHVTGLGLQYSVGFYAHQPIADALHALPRGSWRAAVDSDGEPRDGAQVAELTRWLPVTVRGWPDGMRIIARRERPHPGAQLRLTDHEGWRITVFATNTPGGRLADLELRHRGRARAEDRIRALKDSGLRNLPLHDFAQNMVWLELVQLAADLLAWTQHLALADTPARVWEPKRLRLRLLHVAARIVRTGRRHRLRLPRGWPWAALITHGHQRLHALT